MPVISVSYEKLISPIISLVFYSCAWFIPLHLIFHSEFINLIKEKL